MKIKFLAIFGAALLLFVAVDANAQGRGRGGGGRNGGGHAGDPPSGIGGVNHGLGTASTRSNGRSDVGLGNASSRSNGRSDAGIDRARLAGMNANRMSDNDLNRYRGLSRKLGMTPEEMRALYQAALLANPHLKYGQFVAANVIADNLGGRFPNVTAANILAGLANGDSIGETLRNLRLTKEQARIAERDAEDRINVAKTRNK